MIRVLDREFEASTYSLRSLFADAQRRIVDHILQASIEEAEAAFADVYEERAPLLRFLADLNIPRPRPFMVAAEYVRFAPGRSPALFAPRIPGLAPKTFAYHA